MRHFIAAVWQVMAMLAAAARTAGRWTRKAGEWVYEMLPSPGGVPVPMPEPEWSVENTRQADQEIANLRAVAAMVSAGRIPDPHLTGRLTDLQFRWLCACSPETLKCVVRADDKAMRDHLTQRKSIKGVAAFDEAVIAALEEAKSRTSSMQRAKAEVAELMEEVGLQPAM